MSSLNNLTGVSKIKDADLVFLIKIVNKTHASIGMTFLVNGVFITGQLISGKTYYDAVSERMRESGEAGIALSNYFKNSADDVYSPAQDEDAPTTFLHLKDVKVKSDSGELNEILGSYFRIKVEEVDGHAIGSMS